MTAEIEGGRMRLAQLDDFIGAAMNKHIGPPQMLSVLTLYSDHSTILTSSSAAQIDAWNLCWSIGQSIRVLCLS